MTKPSKKVPAAPEKKDYRSLTTGWVAGRRVIEGEVVKLTEREARHEPVEPVVENKNKKAADAK